MKIAILISGEYRTFKQCRKSMSFLDSPDVDVYFSTWDKTSYESPKINLMTEELVNNDIIISDLGFNPKGIIVESTNEFVEKKYNSKMIHRWIKGFNMIKTSGIPYDYVIVTRPDLFFEYPVNLNNLARYNDSLGTLWTHSINEGKLADILLVSSLKIITNILDNLSIETWNKHTEYDWHRWWYSFCISKVDKIIQADEFRGCVFHRYFAKNGNGTMRDIIQSNLDWRDLKLLHQVDLWGREHSLKNWPPEVLSEAESKWAQNYFDKYRNYGKDNL